MAAKPNEAKAGQPRWTYAAGAIVAIGGLVLSIVSYLNPKPDPSKSAVVQPVAPQVVQEADAEGSGTAINAAGIATVAVADAPSSATSAALRGSPPFASQSASQSSRAGGNGVAVNATDSADVKVTKHP